MDTDKEFENESPEVEVTEAPETDVVDTEDKPIPYLDMIEQIKTLKNEVDILSKHREEIEKHKQSENEKQKLLAEQQYKEDLIKFASEFTNIIEPKINQRTLLTPDEAKRFLKFTEASAKDELIYRALTIAREEQSGKIAENKTPVVEQPKYQEPKIGGVRSGNVSVPRQESLQEQTFRLYRNK